MPVTFQGSAVTPHIHLSGGVMFSIANTFRSRCVVDVARLISQVDSTGPPSAAAGHVMPLLRTRRCAAAGISGGVLLTDRAAWDTEVNAPDSGVEVRCSGGYFGAPITATPADPLWQQFTARQSTAAEQNISEDFRQVPSLPAADNHLYLQPGQAIIIECIYGTQPTAGVAFFQIAWGEDQTDAGYVVGGKVTLDSVNRPGAMVHILTAPDLDMTNPRVETLTTDASGDYSTTLSSATRAAVFVQYRDGATLYTDDGKPYIEP